MKLSLASLSAAIRPLMQHNGASQVFSLEPPIIVSSNMTRELDLREGQ